MEEVASKIGKIVLNFSSLELTVCSFVSKLISDDVKIGSIITSEMSFQNLIKAFDSLMKYKFSDKRILDKWEILRAKLNICEQERNIYIHSNYMHPHEVAGVTRFKITSKQRRGLKVDKEDINLNHLTSILEGQNNLINQLHLFYKQIFNEDKLIKVPFSNNVG